jgi:hypothetical protein
MRQQDLEPTGVTVGKDPGADLALARHLEDRNERKKGGLMPPFQSKPERGRL